MEIVVKFVKIKLQFRASAVLSKTFFNNRKYGANCQTIRKYIRGAINESSRRE